jgi:peptidoglycan/xylan/chitin deacetylase (PgdA/CDA1 family)
MPVQKTQVARPIPILVYHQIAEASPKGTPFRSLCVAPAAFARQMALLRLLGWQGLSMSALMPYLRGERQGRVFGITLDDGYRNNLDHALPVLRRHGFSATCYAVSQLLGQSNVWDHALGIPASALMTLDELKAWVAGGQELGSHTRHHVRLPEVSPSEARDEIVRSRSELEQGCGVPVRHFCYPYGAYQPSHVTLAQSAAYDSATLTRRGRCLGGESFWELPRVPVVRSTSLPMLLLKMMTSYEDRHGQ